MQVTVEDLSSIKKLLHIEVSEDAVNDELSRAYKDLKKKAKIKGYRPGKVPRPVLERIYKKDVCSDVLNRLIQTSFADAVKENSLDIIGQPSFDPPEFEGKGPYKYDATVEIRPEIGDVDFSGLTLEKSLYSVRDEEIDAQLKMLQKKMSQKKPLAEKRPLQMGDLALIDFEGFNKGAPFEETEKTENFTLKIGDSDFAKEFDEKLIGMNIGETREIEVHFPPDCKNERLADLDIDFKVVLNDINVEVVPEIDDEFARSLGNYEKLDDLRDVIRNNLQQGYEQRVKQELNEQVFQALLSRTNFEVPDSLVEHELNNMIAEAERSLSASNISMEEAGFNREKFSEKYRDTAVKQVQRHLILDKIIEQEKLSLSEEDLENSFKDISKTLNKPIEEVRKHYRQDHIKLMSLRQIILEKNAVDLIIESSVIHEAEPEEQPEPVNQV